MSSHDSNEQSQKDDTRTGGNAQSKGGSKRSDDAPSRTGGNAQTKGASKRNVEGKK